MLLITNHSATIARLEIAAMQLLLLLVLIAVASSDISTIDSDSSSAYNVSNSTVSAIYTNIADNLTATALSNVKLRRGKRYLDFTRGTRMSWRTSMKNNIVDVNTLWAYGMGFRVNFPFRDRKDRLRPFNKRDVVQTLEESLSVHGLDGRACVLKSFCSAMLDAESHLGGGMLYKILKLLFSLDSIDKRHFPYLKADYCHQIIHAHCLLSFDHLSPYTDEL